MVERVIQVIGLQRSGNHAIITWLMSTLPGSRFGNNRPHDLLADPAALAPLLAEDRPALILSFEDDADRFVAGSRSLADIAPLRPEDFPGQTCTTLYVLRDPFNTWASREVAQGRQGLTGLHDLDAFVDNWLHVAARHAEDPAQVILYSRWMQEEGYRRAICDRFGGAYTERTLDHVPHQGGGSTFEVVEQRPTYRQILARLPRYASAPFLRRLARAPGRYARLLVSPRATARSLDTMNRWSHIVGDPACRRLFTDPRLRAESDRIFGFHVDPEGRRVPAGAAAGA